LKRVLWQGLNHPINSSFLQPSASGGFYHGVARMTTALGGGPQDVPWAGPYPPGAAERAFGLEWLSARLLPWAAGEHLTNNTKRRKGKAIMVHACVDGEDLHPVPAAQLVKLISSSPEPWDVPEYGEADERAGEMEGGYGHRHGPWEQQQQEHEEEEQQQHRGGDVPDGDVHMQERRPGSAGDCGAAADAARRRLLVSKSRARCFLLKSACFDDLGLSMRCGAWPAPAWHPEILGEAFERGDEVLLIMSTFKKAGGWFG
jgi:hypothetical protein